MTFNEQLCLDADPFDGDFGSPGDRVLRDEIVTARKAHKDCDCCLGGIERGERNRIQICIFDGRMKRYRWCAKCCTAMANSWNDEGRMWGSRERLRRIRCAQ